MEINCRTLHKRIILGLNIINSKAEIDCSSFGYIPNSFFNGAPNNPKGCYYTMELASSNLNEKDLKQLEELGWDLNDYDQYVFRIHGN